MRYSHIVGKGFYRISLTPQDYKLLDIHFSGASHHLYRCKEAMATKQLDLAKLHSELHRKHLNALMTIVHDRGGFTFAKDDSGRNMDVKESWDMHLNSTPDPDMFNSMLPDMRHQLGENHYYDQYLQPLVRSHEFRPNLQLVANC